MATTCGHDFKYSGAMWYDDGILRPGSGATTIHYVQTYYCSRCCELQAVPTPDNHDSYTHKRAGTSPLPTSEVIKLKKGSLY
jgi:hypothetical protein